MPRPQKDYQVAPSPELLIGNPGALLVNVVDADGQLECAFDFAVFAARPRYGSGMGAGVPVSLRPSGNRPTGQTPIAT
jgi:hypothetical protein